MFFTRNHTLASQIAFGLIFGGIAGNLTDRFARRPCDVDFIYFYMQQRGGNEIGFPAFNVADSAICTGVGLIFLITWKNEHAPKPNRRTDSPSRSREKKISSSKNRCQTSGSTSFSAKNFPPPRAARCNA